MHNTLSVVIPCFNEEQTIAEVVSTVLKQPTVGQVIIIDDNSSDSSLIEILKFSNNRKVEILKNKINMGKGYSVSRGLQLIRCKYVIIQDADLEYDPSEYKKILKPMVDGLADVVYGSRFIGSEMHRVNYFWHKVGNRFLTTLSNMFSNLSLSDMETCYKAFTSDVAKKISLKEKRFGLEPELTAKFAALNCKVYEVSISYRGRTYSEGKKITWKDGFSAIRCIFKYNLFSRH
jgi:glycosyltransferase involved in cell wall biosynthesis